MRRNENPGADSPLSNYMTLRAFSSVDVRDRGVRGFNESEFPLG